jgi:hypothetical protein
MCQKAGSRRSSGSGLISTMLQPISPFRSGEFSTHKSSSCADVVDAAVKTTIAPSKSLVENLLMDRSVTVEAQRSLLKQEPPAATEH